MRVLPMIAAGMIAAGAVTSARADVVGQGETGFAVSETADVKASPAAVWAALVKPGSWWNSAHSWSGSAANMTLTPVPGGCFCETLPGGGFAEHARVIFAAPEKMLRLSGAFGPMQGEALAGTLTVTLEGEAGGATKLTFDYVVGGYARFPLSAMPAAVDKVIGEQHARLKRLIETGKADLPNTP